MTVTEIDTEIVSLKEQLAACRGTECEVYARIVGYYRNIKNWNPGKTQENTERVLFKVPEFKD